MSCRRGGGCRKTGRSGAAIQWYDSRGSLLLFVPPAIVPVEGSPDMNVLINHRHPAAASVRMVGAEPFMLDVRLF